MQTINRNLIYITPKQKCIDWVNRAYPEDSPFDYKRYASQHDNASVFLIPEFETEKEAISWINKSWDMWFENLLLDWCMDESRWPQNRSLEMLNEFFDFKWQSVVEDTLPLPIKKT